MESVPQSNSQSTSSPEGGTPLEPTTVSSRNSRTAPSRSGKLSRGATLLIIFGLLLSSATGFFGGWLGASGYENADSLSGVGTTRQQQIAANQGQLIASIAKTVGPSVVSVNVVSQTEDQTTFFGLTVPGQQQESAGTGIIISSDGLIVTNRHVVPSGATNVSVTMSDGTQLKDVSVVGRTSDADSLDIAFLKITDLQGKKLVPAEIGDSSKVSVGDTVVAIGNALGQFQNTVTSGIISGYGRSVQAGDESGSEAENLTDLFQTDAAINQGNSGGPLVNTAGQVVGINTAVSGSGQNLGFAIPMNDVSGLIKQVLMTGKFERPYLGVHYVLLTPAIAKEAGVAVDQGAYVLPTTDASDPSVVSNGPADKAGIQDKDVITAVDGTKIDDKNSLVTLVGQHEVGDKVKLTVLRDGKTLSVQVTLSVVPTD